MEGCRDPVVHYVWKYIHVTPGDLGGGVETERCMSCDHDAAVEECRKHRQALATIKLTTDPEMLDGPTEAETPIFFLTRLQSVNGVAREAIEPGGEPAIERLHAELVQVSKERDSLRAFAEDLKDNGPLKRIGIAKIRYCVEWITRKAGIVLEAIDERTV